MDAVNRSESTTKGAPEAVKIKDFIPATNSEFWAIVKVPLMVAVALFTAVVEAVRLKFLPIFKLFRVQAAELLNCLVPCISRVPPVKLTVPAPVTLPLAKIFLLPERVVPLPTERSLPITVVVESVVVPVPEVVKL